MKILITGGARSGKSIFAESLFAAESEVTYLATYIRDPVDHEMQDRIQAHQAQRNPRWQTIEVSTALRIEQPRILMDCLSLFTSNVLFYHSQQATEISPKLFSHILQHLKQEIDFLLQHNHQLIIVTNEIGSGLVPEHPISRVYRDLLGKINQYTASQMDEVYLIVCGQPLKIKGS